MTVRPIAITEADARRLTERIQRIQSSRVDLVSRIASEPWKVFPNLRPRRGDVRVGAHLYLMQAGATGPVKIGRANDPHRRARELQPGCADPIAIRATLRDRGEEERAVHAMFGYARLSGEWFEPLPAIFEWFEVLS